LEGGGGASGRGGNRVTQDLALPRARAGGENNITKTGTPIGTKGMTKPVSGTGENHTKNENKRKGNQDCKKLKTRGGECDDQTKRDPDTEKRKEDETHTTKERSQRELNTHKATRRSTGSIYMSTMERISPPMGAP